MSKKNNTICIGVATLLFVAGFTSMCKMVTSEENLFTDESYILNAYALEEAQDLTNHCEENECYLKYKIDEKNQTAIASSYYMGNIPYWDELPKEIVIAETYNGYPVTAIGNGAFSYVTFPETIVIPNSIQKIGGGAFGGATGLKSITLPDGITVIENGTFNYCESLENLNLPDSVTIIGAETFYRCLSLKKIHFPVELKEMGENCCESCTSLKTVYLSDKLQKIGSCAFEDTALTDVYYDGTKEQWKAIKIDENNTVLEKATIHFADGTTAIGHDVTVITPAETQETTEPETQDLTSHCVPNICDLSYRVNDDTAEAYEMVVIVEFPKDREELPKEFVVADTFNGYPVASIASEAFFEADFLESIILPDSVEKIGKYSFECCHKLKEMHFPKNLKTLEEGAFMDCSSLEAIYFSDSLESIGAECFDANDTALTDVYYAGTKEQWEKIAIAGGNTALENATIHFNTDTTGDCNNDGKFSVTDVILLQKWLLKKDGVQLSNWRAVDFYQDGKLNVIDLALMKKALTDS